MTLIPPLIVLLALPLAALPQAQPLDRAADSSGESGGHSMEKIRSYAAQYIRSLPNYTCTQFLHRVRTPNFMAGPRGVVDDIVEQVGYVDRQELHKLVRMNGRTPSPADRTDEGLVSRGEFATLLDVLFQPATHADFKWDRVSTLIGRKVDVFDFHVPKERGYALIEGDRTVLVAIRGKLYAEQASGAVLRIQFNCIDIPLNPYYARVSLTLDYKQTAVAGQQFVLPAHYELRVRNDTGDTSSDADYRDYRRFTSASSITFEEGK